MILQLYAGHLLLVARLNGPAEADPKGLCDDPEADNETMEVVVEKVRAQTTNVPCSIGLS